MPQPEHITVHQEVFGDDHCICQKGSRWMCDGTLDHTLRAQILWVQKTAPTGKGLRPSCSEKDISKNAHRKKRSCL